MSNNWNIFLHILAPIYRHRKIWALGCAFILAGLLLAILFFGSGCAQPVTPFQANQAIAEADSARQAYEAAMALPEGPERDRAIQSAFARLAQAQALVQVLQKQALEASVQAENWATVGKGGSLAGLALSLISAGVGEYLRRRGASMAAEASAEAEQQRQVAATLSANINTCRAGMTPQQWALLENSIRAQQVPVKESIPEVRAAAAAIPKIMEEVAAAARAAATLQPAIVPKTEVKPA